MCPSLASLQSDQVGQIAQSLFNFRRFARHVFNHQNCNLTIWVLAWIFCLTWSCIQWFCMIFTLRCCPVRQQTQVLGSVTESGSWSPERRQIHQTTPVNALTFHIFLRTTRHVPLRRSIKTWPPNQFRFPLAFLFDSCSGNESPTICARNLLTCLFVNFVAPFNPSMDILTTV